MKALFGLLIMFSSIFCYASLEDDLVQAAALNDKTKVIELLDLGVSADCNDGFYTPLIRAVHYSNDDIISLLIDRGAKPNFSDPHTRTPMDWAIQGREFHIMVYLHQSGADLNLLSERRSLLQVAINSLRDANDRDQVEFQHKAYFWLFANGFELKKDQATLINTLSTALSYGDLYLLQDLFQKGDFKSKTNDYDMTGSPPLVTLMFGRQNEEELIKMAKFLVSQQADPNKPDDQGGFALGAARYMGLKKMVKYLESIGARE
ncbi:MAG: ankyrin repeat domain-containing protein [Bdellovibrionota bacterium]